MCRLHFSLDGSLREWICAAVPRSTPDPPAALKAMQSVMQFNIPQGQWEDFETYWSCSRYGSKDQVGKKVHRNDMYKQNNFSMYWTAEALLKTYQITGEKIYLRYGQRTLDELLMTQACWQPPYMYVNVLGGFGVMNGDGEWNDARQSLYAELILDYGFMMENYGHGGETDEKGGGIGEFTIYDWGNGAASEAYNRSRIIMENHLYSHVSFADGPIQMYITAIHI